MRRGRNMAADKTKRALHPLIWTVIGLTVASVILLLVGLLLPPQGEVHPTLLRGLAIVTADIALVNFAYAVVSGKTATFKHGQTTATVRGKTSGRKQ